MKSRTLFALAFVLGTFGAARAGADETATSLSPPPLTVTLTPGSGGGPWKLKIENTGDVPVRISADPRLLALEVTPPADFVEEATAKAKRPAAKKADDLKPVRCALPDDARPASDDGRELVVPSKRSWSVSVDPLLYCFGARERARLVKGATVKARFGWPMPVAKAGGAKAKAAPVITSPFVAAPVGAAVGKIAPAKELEAAEITLTESPSTSTSTSTSTGMAISLPETLDVARGHDVSATVTITNEGDKPATLLFRPETLRLHVAGPAGSLTCGSLRTVSSPIRELFSTIGVKGRASNTILVTAMCPAGTFDDPGVYRVTPVLDTTNASGRAIGLKTWDGSVTGQPMLLRVRSQRRPNATPTRPSLD